MAFGFSYPMAVLIQERHHSDPDDVFYAVLAICVERNITPSEISGHIGVSKTAVYDWINGKYAVSDAAKEALRKYLKVLNSKKPTAKA